MSLVTVVLKLFLGTLLACPCITLAWEEDPQDSGYVLDQDFPQAQSLPAEMVMRLGGRSGDTEVGPSDWLRPQQLPPSYYGSRRVIPSDWESFQGVKRKRYMGMEIPEFITKGDGTGGGADVGGGGAPRGGMKQKLLNSG